MKIFVRIIAIVLLLGTTIIFVLKVRLHIPIAYKHLIGLFVLGAASLFWANFRESNSSRKKLEDDK